MSIVPRSTSDSSAPFQLFKDLPPAIESALRDSIDRFGVLVPIAKDQHGNILDGHQRARIAESLGVKYPVNIIEVTDDAEALEIARTLNEDRRAMPKAERLEVVKALREDGHSVRAIAGAVGVDPKQVQRDLAGVDMSTPATVTGRDGKSYPARKTLKLPEREALRATGAASGRRAAPPAGTGSLAALARDRQIVMKRAGQYGKGRKSATVADLPPERTTHRWQDMAQGRRAAHRVEARRRVRAGSQTCPRGKFAVPPHDSPLAGHGAGAGGAGHRVRTDAQGVGHGRGNER